ncbi:hypothetical protein [Thalassovita taeanensis]|uniref:DUF883 domain-containing protein n=1 Tax=Thalassovita taeanensis TaxID=657014 RepID=A0A1H9BYH0_9RHOB|nr:hypothetical protein [Thalassovita taeanensis]SEP93781.1 hypothetical protein SAMN04488092_10345 [Thalassovita taeanensis]
MSLMSEIMALQAEIEASARKTPTAKAAPEPDLENAEEMPELETFMKTMHETMDEFSEDIARYPQLTALAALGIGFAAGIIIGRQFR